MPKERDWSDIEMLTILDLHDNGKLTYEQIATRFNTTRSSIAGLISRVNRLMKKTDPDGNQNGTMPQRWWKR